VVGVILLGIWCAGSLFRPVDWFRGVLFALSGLLLIPPPTAGGFFGWFSNLLGFALGLALVTWQWQANRLSRAELAEPPRVRALIESRKEET
jgi:hypothetical protein